MDRVKVLLGALALAVTLAGTAHGQAIEKKQLTLGVGGKTALYYLPLTIAERLGHFKEQGIDVTINDFRGGAQSLQALAGGSVDVVTGVFAGILVLAAFVIVIDWAVTLVERRLLAWRPVAVEAGA